MQLPSVTFVAICPTGQSALSSAVALFLVFETPPISSLCLSLIRSVVSEFQTEHSQPLPGI